MRNEIFELDRQLAAPTYDGMIGTFTTTRRMPEICSQKGKN